jgi:hypothetical protein
MRDTILKKLLLAFWVAACSSMALASNVLKPERPVPPGDVCFDHPSLPQCRPN